MPAERAVPHTAGAAIDQQNPGSPAALGKAAVPQHNPRFVLDPTASGSSHGRRAAGPYGMRLICGAAGVRRQGRGWGWADGFGLHVPLPRCWRARVETSC